VYLVSLTSVPVMACKINIYFVTKLNAKPYWSKGVVDVVPITEIL
jgi:hypothetical protein